MQREHEDFGRGPYSVNLCTGSEPTHVLALKIHQNQVGVQFPYLRDRFNAVRGFSTNG